MMARVTMPAMHNDRLIVLPPPKWPHSRLPAWFRRYTCQFPSASFRLFSTTGFYLAVMHAGVVMAPVVGRLATGEIVAGNEVGALAPCRVSRFG